MTRYRDDLESIIAGSGLTDRYRITYKTVFGAAAAYADDAIFLTLGKFGVAVKLPGATCQALMDDGVGGPLKYFEKGHVKRNYVVLGNDLLKDKARMGELLGESAAFVQTKERKT